jgi:hypothetical protein
MLLLIETHGGNFVKKKFGKIRENLKRPGGK